MENENNEYPGSYGEPQQEYNQQDYQQQNVSQSYNQQDNSQQQNYNQQSYQQQSYQQQNYNQQQSYQQNYNQQQSYQQQNYNQQQSYQQNYATGGVPLDEKGQPLKNNFGLKLFFSILEMLTCCMCNPVTLVLGIFGCVYAVKANNAYQEGKWDEFKGHAKTSSICLWVGLAVIAVYMVFAVASIIFGGGMAAVYETYEAM